MSDDFNKWPVARSFAQLARELAMANEKVAEKEEEVGELKSERSNTRVGGGGGERVRGRERERLFCCQCGHMKWSHGFCSEGKDHKCNPPPPPSFSWNTWSVWWPDMRGLYV